MDNIEQVLEQMKKLFAEMQRKNDQKLEEIRKAGGGAGSAETREQVDKMNTDVTELRKLYDDLLVASKRPAVGDTGNSEKDIQAELRKSAFIKFCRYGNGETAQEHLTVDEKRALQNSSDADGGFLVPIDFESGVLMEAYNEAALRPVCNVGTTGRDTVFFGALAKPTVAWGTDGVAVSAQDLAAGGHTMSINDLKALTLISNNTLDDSDANIWSELSMAFADALAEAEDDAFATGTAQNTPQGVISNSLVQANFTISGIANGLIDASDSVPDGITALITALYKLKKTYRRNATWAMNSTTEGVYRNSKDTTGQYLWQPPVQAGAPATLLGKPVVNPEGMPAHTTDGLFPVVVGDFRRGYKIRDRSGISVQRLSERYAEYDQTGFIIKKRVGGQVVLDEAFQCIKVGAS